MFKIPFKVRLADPGMAFFDPDSKLRLTGTDVVEVKVFTPTTEQFVRGGGLVVVEGDLSPAPETTPAGETSTQEPSEPPAGASSGDSAPSAPSSLDELLAQADADAKSTKKK